ncbi:MAG: enhanced serine sensitivity protein SseB [Lachnospiraceae bacterium]|nr:enhanced serine sensitivity protein SseB [Lachnospiraceae bacterium]
MGVFDNFLGKKEQAEPEETEKSESNTGYKKVDVNKPLENFRLNVLLKETKENQTETGMNMLFEEIVMNAHFLSVIFLSELPKPNEDGTATFQKNTTMQMPMLSSAGGKHFYPVFTDHNELAKWQKMEKPNTLILTFDDYAAFLEKNEQAEGIVINPFSDNFVLNRKLMAHLKTQKDLRTKGVSRNKITKDTKVMVGEPKEYPTEMVEALQAHMKGVPAIERAWLRLMMKDNVQSFLVVVDFAGNREEIFGQIAAVARPHLKNIYLDMIPYQDGFGKKAVENVEPFYQK